METHNDKVVCQGDKGSEHPKIYLVREKNSNLVLCPYCGKEFVFSHNIGNDHHE